MPEPANFDFSTYALSAEPKCISKHTIYMLTSRAEQKENQRHRNSSAEGNILITDKALQKVLSKGRLEKFLGCLCLVCGEITRKTDPEEDKKLAARIARDIQHQRLFAALAFMGGIFAARALYKYDLNSVAEVEANMQDRDGLCRELFVPFERAWSTTQCCHESTHATRDYPFCLAQSFQEQLKAKRWILETPKFEADNLLRNFGERQNMPFVHDTLLGWAEGRAYFEFKIHADYCDEQLRVSDSEDGVRRKKLLWGIVLHVDRILFRKQISTKSATVQRRAEEERDILKFLKDLAHPYIAQVLFAFQEDHPPRLSLIFERQPTDLRKILYPSNGSTAKFEAPKTTSGRFRGSKLDDWRWEGILGIFDAVAAVHFPLEYSTSIPIPQSGDQTLIGGHFDIKPANIIINQRGQFLLTDFGQAYFKIERKGEATNLTIVPGTFNYMPPPSYSEQKAEKTTDIIEKKRWTREYDVWSLACVVVEVLASIVDGLDAPEKFFEEREREDDDDKTLIKSAKFWITRDDQETLKQCVEARLDSYKDKGDDYLARVAGVVESMFQVQRTQPKAVKACYQELSASVKRDRYLFQGRDDVLVADQGTRKCLKDMLTSFSTDRVAPFYCSLYMWRNLRRDRLSLTIEFADSESSTTVKPDSTSRTSDMLIPFSLFNTDVLFDNHRFRHNSTPLQFAFRDLHDGVTFHISRRSDYYYIQGALTHHLPVAGSEQRFHKCIVESTLDYLRSTTTTAIGGHLQIWRTLDTKTYDWYYLNVPTPSISIPISSSGDSSSTSSSTTQNLSIPGKPGSGLYLLCLYLCDQEKPSSRASSAATEGKSLVVVSLYRNTFDCTFKRNPPRMILERKSESKNKKIYGTIFGMSTSVEPSLSNSPSPPPSEVYPGIPLSDEQFKKQLETDRGFRKVEVEFWNDAALESFEALYRRLYPK